MGKVDLGKAQSERNWVSSLANPFNWSLMPDYAIIAGLETIWWRDTQRFLSVNVAKKEGGIKTAIKLRKLPFYAQQILGFSRNLSLRFPEAINHSLTSCAAKKAFKMTAAKSVSSKDQACVNDRTESFWTAKRSLRKRFQVGSKAFDKFPLITRIFGLWSCFSPRSERLEFIARSGRKTYHPIVSTNMRQSRRYNLTIDHVGW